MRPHLFSIRSAWKRSAGELAGVAALALCGVALCGAVAVLPAQAQDKAPAGAAPVEPQLAKTPTLKKLIPAKIPAGTRFPTPEVVVVLKLEVDERGGVSRATVETGAGEPFDKAALDAARQFDFEPGRLTTGEAVPVTVTFRLRITEPPPPPPAPVTLVGRLIERGTRKPIGTTQVEARDGDALLARTQTDEQGRFTLQSAKARFRLIALPTGHQKLDLSIDAVPGEKREANWYLEANAGAFETTVRAAPIRTEVVRRTIDKKEIETSAGTQGDALKAIQNLPGVARPPFGGGPPVLRGANPEDSRIFVEGQEIPLLYHFGGLRSTIATVFLESVDYIPGNFSPDFGRATGGIINVRLRDPAKDTFRGLVDLNLYDAGFALEGPLSQSWSMGGAFRRSYIDTILAAVLPSDAPVSFNSAPRFYDYQLLATYQPDKTQKLRLFWYGSNDKVSILFANPAGDPAIRGGLSARTAFHNLQAQYEYRFSPTFKQETSLLFGLQNFDIQLGPERYFNLGVQRVSARSTWSWQAAPTFTLRGGIDATSSNVDISLNLPRRPLEGEVLVPLSTMQSVATNKAAYIFQPALFFEGAWKPFPKLELLPGFRVDWYNVINRWSFDPRFVARYEVVPGTVLKAGVGLYQQPPTPDQADNTLGNPRLDVVRSLQTSLGVEQRLRDGINLDAVGFYKKLDRVVVSNAASSFSTGAPPYQNDGTGRIYGFELSLKAQVTPSLNFYLAYTYQRSFRTDRPGVAERPFDFDQPHILTVLGSWEIGRGWRTSLRFRLVSGNPDTPALGAVYDARTDTYIPTYGAVNSIRQAIFHQLDFRVDKTWTFERWKLSLYLDIQNAYNQGNQEGITFSYDYSQQKALTGLPILPLLGLKGEW